MPRRPHLSLGLAAAAVLCAACAPAPLRVLPFRQADDASRCASLIAALPTTVGGQARRPTSGTQDAVAWGGEPIVAKCGVPIPDGFQPTSQCLTVNGVDWFVSTLADATSPTVVTTVYRSPAVELSIPRVYGAQSPSTEMIDVSPALVAHSTVTGHCK